MAEVEIGVPYDPRKALERRRSLALELDSRIIKDCLGYASLARDGAVLLPHN